MFVLDLSLSTSLIISKSLEINKIRECQTANGALFLLSTNDKTIKVLEGENIIYLFVGF